MSINVTGSGKKYTDDKIKNLKDNEISNLETKKLNSSIFNEYKLNNDTAISRLDETKADDVATKQSIATERARINQLLNGADSYYKKCLSTDTGALLVVDSEATTGQINLASVTPVLSGYTPVAGDYVHKLSDVLLTGLNDIKVGADGNTYASPGDAVRGQYNQLKGDLDTLNQGGLNLKEDFIGRQVDEWLNEHPESTTTVQNDSLNESKFTLATRKRIVREYKTLADALSDNIWDNNTFIRTHGFDTIDDGGGGVYMISGYSPNDGNPCYIPYRDGYYLNYIPENGRVNVLALGVKNDGSEDCSGIIQNFVQCSTVLTKQYYTLFFPPGIYRCDNPLEFTKDVSFEGVCSANAYNGFFYNDELYPKKFGSIIYYPSADDTTLMTVNIRQNGCCSLKNLLFISDSTKFSNDGFATRPSIPYNPFTLTKNANNCNGVNIVKSKVSVDNCGFVGFSGFGLKTSSHNVADCYFAKCGDGVALSASDLMLNNCYITQCINGIKCVTHGVLFVKNTFIDQCVEHGIYSDAEQATLVLNGCTIDHIGYAGVCVVNALDCNIDSRMGRCGMYYAGKTDFSDLLEDEKRKAVTIYFGNLHTGNMRLNIYKRNITDDSMEDTYKLPYVVFGGNYENLVVTGLHGNDYKFFDDASVISNTTVYADDGIHTYS